MLLMDASDGQDALIPVLIELSDHAMQLDQAQGTDHWPMALISFCPHVHHLGC